VRGLRYWSMYALSAVVGYLLGGVLLLLGQRFRRPVSELVRTQATEHARQAADKQGPYLAPVTALGFLLAAGLLAMALGG
jgi:hypothetical protein